MFTDSSVATDTSSYDARSFVLSCLIVFKYGILPDGVMLRYKQIITGELICQVVYGSNLCIN